MGTGYGDDPTCIYDPIPCNDCGGCEEPSPLRIDRHNHELDVEGNEE